MIDCFHVFLRFNSKHSADLKLSHVLFIYTTHSSLFLCFLRERSLGQFTLFTSREEKEQKVKRWIFAAKNKRRQNYIVDGFYVSSILLHFSSRLCTPIALIFIFLIFFLAKDRKTVSQVHISRLELICI